MMTKFIIYKGANLVVLTSDLEFDCQGRRSAYSECLGVTPLIYVISSLLRDSFLVLDLPLGSKLFVILAQDDTPYASSAMLQVACTITLVTTCPPVDKVADTQDTFVIS